MSEITFGPNRVVPTAPTNPPRHWEVEGNSTHGPLGVGDINGGHHGPITGEICPKVWPLRGCVSESSGRSCMQMKIAGLLSAILLFDRFPKDILDTLACRVRCAVQEPKEWHRLIQEIVESSPGLLFSGHRVSPLPSVELNIALEHLLGIEFDLVADQMR